MLKVRFWIGAVSAPVLFASAGCAITPFPTSASRRGMTPDRLMEMAQTFERQGHLPQAKYAYYQVLAAQPAHPGAQDSLDSLIAYEQRQNQLKFGHQPGQPNVMVAQTQHPAGIPGHKQSNPALPISPTLAQAAPANLTDVGKTSSELEPSTAQSLKSDTPRQLEQSLPEAPAPNVSLMLRASIQQAIDAETTTASAAPQIPLPNSIAQSTEIAQQVATSLPTRNVQHIPAMETSTELTSPPSAAPPAGETTPADSSDRRPDSRQSAINKPSVSILQMTFDLPPAPTPQSADRVHPTKAQQSFITDLTIGVLPPTVVTPTATVAQPISAKDRTATLKRSAESRRSQVAAAPVDRQIIVQQPTPVRVQHDVERLKANIKKALVERPLEPVAEKIVDTTSVWNSSNGQTSEPAITSTVPTMNDEDFQMPIPIDEFASPYESPRFDSEKKGVAVSVTLELEDPAEINLDQIVNPELHQFFQSFDVGMVASLRAQRDKYQQPLTEIAVNRSVEKEMRCRAVFLLGELGPDACDAVPAFRREMHTDSDMYFRVDLAESILKIQPEDSDAIKTLIECLKDQDQNLRWVAAFSLRNAVSPRTTFVINHLEELLATEDAKLKRMVILTLGEFGPAAAQVVPKLEAALQSPDPSTREVAQASLCNIDPNRKGAANLGSPLRLTDLNNSK